MFFFIGFSVEIYIFAENLSTPTLPLSLLRELLGDFGSGGACF
jgi:hypothetical protein